MIINDQISKEEILEKLNYVYQYLGDIQQRHCDSVSCIDCPLCSTEECYLGTTINKVLLMRYNLQT